MNVIKFCTCDFCGRYDEGVECYSNGTPVFFGCKACGPNLYRDALIAATEAALQAKAHAQKTWLNSLN